MRLIDADAIPYTMLYKENFLAGTGYEAQAVWKKDIDAMPTIEERKTGKWVGIQAYCDHMNEITVGSRYIPSGLVCGVYCNQCWELNTEKKNFCPHCGADMRGATS